MHAYGRRKETIGGLRYFIELLVIIVGITISFMLQQWQQNRENHTMTIQMLERIREDLVEDSIAIHTERDLIQRIIEHTDKLLSNPTATNIQDSVPAYLISQLQYASIFKTSIGYKMMEEQGGSGMIANKNLLKSIVRLYIRQYGILDEYHSIDKRFVLEEYMPFFHAHIRYVERFDYSQLTPRELKALLSNDHFRNLLRANLVLKSTIHHLYAETLSEIRAVHNDLSEELKRLSS